MIIGLDFDNTIVNYEHAVRKLSYELHGIPENVSRTKLHLRNFLRSQNRESEWTVFQGNLYGPGMEYAEPFEGAIEAMLLLERMSYQLAIISHRTLHPYLGPKHALHSYAKDWIKRKLNIHGLFENNFIYFLQSKKQKIATIERVGCSIFLDDLSEILEDPDFPDSARGILFSANESGVELAACRNKRIICEKWADLPTIINSLSEN